MSAVADPGRAGERTIYSSRASGRRIPRGPDNAQCARTIQPSEPSSPFRGARPVRADVLMTARWRSSPTSGRGIESRRDGSALAAGGWPWVDGLGWMALGGWPWPCRSTAGCADGEVGESVGPARRARRGRGPRRWAVAARRPRRALPARQGVPATLSFVRGRDAGCGRARPAMARISPMRGISHGARRRPRPLGAGIRPVKTAAPSGPERVPNAGWPRRGSRSGSGPRAGPARGRRWPRFASDTARESPRHAYRERRERATEHRWPPSRDNRRHGPESVNRRWAAIRWPARVDAWSPSVGRNRHRSIFIRVGVFPARRACTGGSGNPTPLHLTAGEAMAFPEAQGRR
jgi:hypothetical protein